MYLLIDECCGKALVAVAERLGHTAQRIQDVAALGRGCDDRIIFEFARKHGAVLVTIDRSDYASLANHGRNHPGVILLPSALGKDLARLFRSVLPVAERVFARERNTFVEIDARRRITSFRLP